MRGHGVGDGAGRDFQAALSPLAGLPGVLCRNRKSSSQNRGGRGAPPAFVCRSPVSGVRPELRPVVRRRACACRHGPQRCRCAEAGERQAPAQEASGRIPGLEGPRGGLVSPSLPGSWGPASASSGRRRYERAAGLCGSGLALGSRRWLGASSFAGGLALSVRGPAFGEGSSSHGFRKSAPSF